MLVKVPQPEDESSTPTWFIIWKKQGSPEYKDGLLPFGFAKSESEIMDRVIGKLATNPALMREARGGIFYPVPVHLSLVIPK